MTRLWVRRGLIATPVIAVLVLVLVLRGSSPRQVSPVPSPAPRTPAAGGSLRGIFQFTGDPRPDNPSVGGGVLVYSWSDIEPAEGVFRWDRIDADMAVWTRRGKKVAIRVQTTVPTSTVPPATPQWVFAAGVPSVSDRRTTVPLYWDPLYLDKLAGLARALAQRYDGNPGLAWFQGGVGVYGETKVETTSLAGIRAVWDARGYTDQLWFDTIKRIVRIYKDAFHRTPVAISVDSSFIDGTAGYSEAKVVAWLVASGVWPQNDGLRRDSVVRDPSWRGGPNIQEQYLNTARTGDTLDQDLARALDFGATYMLVYGLDIDRPENQAVLARAAAMASP